MKTDIHYFIPAAALLMTIILGAAGASASDVPAVEQREAEANLPGKKVIEIKKGETPISLVSFQEGGYREQSFTATKPFYAVSACVATWAADDAKVELFLYKFMKGIPGTVGWYGAEACPDIQDMPTVIIHESDLGAWYGKTEPAIPFSMRLYVEEE